MLASAVIVGAYKGTPTSHPALVTTRNRHRPVRAFAPPRLAVLAAAAGLCIAPPARGHEPERLDTVTVVGSGTGSAAATGTGDAASAGTVSRRQIEARTAYRPGELLEAVPGLVVTQHSGEGKANQFYLRGFNLDHGTDLRTVFDGVPVNQRSHAHGQGWTDLNFIIPELAGAIDFRKGPYHAADGDFATAGAVSVRLLDTLPDGIASVGLGSHGYRRALLADSPDLGPGHLLYAFEALHNDGPFTRPDDYRKLNGVLRYSAGSAGNGHDVTAMAYRARWNSTDQVPLRAVASGRLGRYDTVDPTDGGASHRYSLSASWRRSTEAGATRANAYVVDWRTDLYSNFTYCPRRPGRRRPVQPAGPPPHHRLRRQPRLGRRRLGAGVREHRRRRLPERQHRQRPGEHPRPADALGGARRPHRADQPGPPRAELDALERLAAHRRRRARRRLPLRRAQRQPGQLGHARRRPSPTRSSR